MTEPNYAKPLTEIPLAPAALQACAECPWRASNLDVLAEKRADNTFNRDKLAGHWKELVEEGSTCRCHVTTPGYYHHDEHTAEAGLKAPRMFKGDGHRQCAGQLAMIRNELQKMVAYPSHAEYIAANPAGLTADVAAGYFRLLEDPDSVDGFRWPAEDVDDVLDPVELVDTQSWAWRMGRHEAADFRNTLLATMPALAACDCRFCSRHEQIHPAEPVTLADGSVVHIDRAIAPVVAEFTAAGVMTLGSCENFGPAVRELDLHAYLTLRDTPDGHVNYSTTLREGGAFVRFVQGDQRGKLLAALLSRYYSVDAHGSTAHVTFPLEDAEKVCLIIRTAAEKSAA